MKYILLLIVLSFAASSAIAQFQIKDTSRTFVQIKAEKDAYFDSLIKKYTKDSLSAEGGEYREYQKWVNFWEPRITPNGTFGKYLRALNYPFKALQNIGDDWTEIGPIVQPASGLSSIGGGALGVGPIQCITIYKPNPDNILAASMAGGLFVSSDKGVHWRNAGSDNWERSGCNWATFSPNDANTWYGCSNMGSNNNRGHSNVDQRLWIGNKGGVYRTTDGGISYTLICKASDFPSPGDGEWTRINKIIVDQNVPSTAYLATSGGLYKSTNVTSLTPSWTRIRAGYIEDIEIKANTNSPIFISVESATQTWDILISNDGGITWTSLPNQPWPSTTEVNTIEVSENAPNLLYILNRQPYVVCCDWNGQPYTIHRTVLYTYDFVASIWTRKTPTTPTTPVGPELDISMGGGHGFAVSNFNKDIIYTSQSIYLYKSIDGGVSWNEICSTCPTTKYHVDIEDLATPPTTCAACSSDVWIANHGGVWFSQDAATTLQCRSSGIGNAEIFGFSNSQTDPGEIVIGLDHDGTMISGGTYSSSWAPTWETAEGGDALPPLIDYSDANFVWAYAVNYINKFELSQNGGHAYSYTGTAFPSIDNTWNTQIAENQVYPNIIYTHGKTTTLMDDLFRSNDRGQTASSIEPISDFLGVPTLPNTAPFVSVYDKDPTLHMNDVFYIWGLHPSPSDPNVLYVRASGGLNLAGPPGPLLLRNRNIMSDVSSVINNWESLPLPLANNWYSTIAVDPINPKIVYVAYSGYWSGALGNMIFSADYTNSGSPNFTDISYNLPPTYYFKIIPEEGTNGGIWVGSDLGVFYSDQTSRTSSSNQWKKIGTNLPNIPVSGLEIDYKIGKVRVAMAGRGVWEHDLVCPSNLSYNFTAPQTATTRYDAVNQITSTSSILSTATLTYRAGTFIQLNPGFITTPNSANSFLAIIHPCSGP